MKNDSTTGGRRSLLRAGMILFLLSLVLSFPLPFYVNRRMALSAHVIGAVESLFIVVLGLFWLDLRLGARLRAATFWLRVYGGYSNWVACILAAIWGASHTTPVAGAGFHALPWQESVVSALLISVGIVDVVAGALIVWGLRGRFPQQGVQEPV